MIQRIAATEHFLRQALADDDYGLATVPVRLIKVASFHQRQPERREEAGRNHPHGCARCIFARLWDVSIGGEFKTEVILAIAPRDYCANGDVLNAGQIADVPR